MISNMPNIRGLDKQIKETWKKIGPINIAGLLNNFNFDQHCKSKEIKFRNYKCNDSMTFTGLIFYKRGIELFKVGRYMAKN